jgi:hypothetical protein
MTNIEIKAEPPLPDDHFAVSRKDFYKKAELDTDDRLREQIIDFLTTAAKDKP